MLQVNFKQMGLYYAIPFGAYYLGVILSKHAKTPPLTRAFSILKDTLLIASSMLLTLILL